MTKWVHYLQPHVSERGIGCAPGVRSMVAEERLAWAVERSPRSPRVSRSRISVPSSLSLLLPLHLLLALFVSSVTAPTSTPTPERRRRQTQTPSLSSLCRRASLHGSLLRLVATALPREPAGARWRHGRGPRGGDRRGGGG